MKILGIIPARAGSKGIKNKNVQLVGGKTLIEWSLIIKSENLLPKIIISTDSYEYENIAVAKGASSYGLRSSIYARDESKSFAIIEDLVSKDITLGDYSHVLLLQPTFPFRYQRDLEEMVTLSKRKNGLSVVSVSQLEEPHPFKLKVIDDDGFVSSFLSGKNSEIPRQELPNVYVLNGGYYLTRVSDLLREKSFLPKKTIPYLMDKRVNIDTQQDLEYARYYFENEWE